MQFRSTVTKVIRAAIIDKPKKYDNALSENENTSLFVLHGDGEPLVTDVFDISQKLE